MTGGYWACDVAGNVEPVRASFAAFNRGDFQVAAACVHPEAELHAHLGAVEWKTYRGPGALVKMWSDLEEAFGGTMQVEVTELIDCEHHVVAVVEALATGRKSGKYKGAKGGGTFNGALPPGSTPAVGTVITFHLDGRARY